VVPKLYVVSEHFGDMQNVSGASPEELCNGRSFLYVYVSEKYYFSYYILIA
jgi:hypothetical protein